MQEVAELFKRRRSEYRRLRKDKWMPMRIEARMRTSVAFIDPIAFDGILSTAVAKDILGDRFFNSQGGERIENSGVVPLPLGIKCDRTAWYWRASYGLISPVEAGVARWKKRWDEDHHHIVDFAGKQEKIPIKLGKYKAYDMPLIVYPTPRLTWFVIGDHDEVSRLLNLITHVGKKNSQGYGEILQWSVVENRDAWRHYKRRALPTSMHPKPPMGDDWKLTETTFHPPYWDIARATECWVPIMEGLIYEGN